MGCGSSGAAASAPEESSAPAPGPVRASSGAVKDLSKMSTSSVRSASVKLSQEKSKSAHDRLQKLRELDKSTKIPFILVELRGEGDRHGFVEVCGKDEYGVYDNLDDWLVKEWSCVKLDSGDLDYDTPVPFSDRSYEWKAFRTSPSRATDGIDGQSNMGLATMRLVDYMCNKLGWTLGVINGGNVGKKGEIREQQVIFKAPHPMNLVAPHVMVELRSAGYIEVCGDHCGIYDDLDAYFKDEFKAEVVSGHEEFCDRYYKCGGGVFKSRGKQGENNMGILTTRVCDFLGRLDGWNLVTMNGGNYGEKGTEREQQLVFRWDNHPLQAQPHVIVELRGSGHIEVCGEDVDDIYNKIDGFVKDTWRCQPMDSPKGPDRLYDRKYKWTPQDMMVSVGEVIAFFHNLGWQMQVCSQGTVSVAGQSGCREQQLLFRPGMSGFGIVEPHLLIELYTGEGDDALYAQPEETQLLGNQYIRMYPVGRCEEAINKFHQFTLDYLGGEVGAAGEDRYWTECFLSRGYTDNNLGCWTMRVCDFMVDAMGWSFVVCNVCNLGPVGQYREQQLIFRYDGARRDIPVTDNKLMTVAPSTFEGYSFPEYWNIPKIANLEVNQEMTPCTIDEKRSLQEIMDNTFRRILTRDRVYEYQASTNEEMPYRLELVHAFRSENMPLCKRLLERTKSYAGGTPVPAKTRQGGEAVNSRLGDGESLLFHGTNPSSSVSILKTGFVLKNAGKSTGTMFGYGVYLAECCSKSDEYAVDDNGGNYPGLRALLVCRSLIGNPYVVTSPGDHIGAAKEAGCDCVMGDRETTVNTYREFVFFDEAQVYPEYAIIYKRQYDPAKVPPKLTHLKQKPTGTTGRSFQVKLDRYWANVAPEANRALVQALKTGETKVSVKLGSEMYEFDLEALEQTNVTSGKARKIRKPMVIDP